MSLRRFHCGEAHGMSWNEFFVRITIEGKTFEANDNNSDLLRWNARENSARDVHHRKANDQNRFEKFRFCCWHEARSDAGLYSDRFSVSRIARCGHFSEYSGIANHRRAQHWYWNTSVRYWGNKLCQLPFYPVFGSTRNQFKWIRRDSDRKSWIDPPKERPCPRPLQCWCKSIGHCGHCLSNESRSNDICRGIWFRQVETTVYPTECGLYEATEDIES